MGSRLGQHFLVNPHVARRIAEFLSIEAGDNVLEIGPGRGALTKHLLDRGARVVGVEVDRELCRFLRSAFGEAGNLTVIEGDILDVDLGELFRGSVSPVKVAGNIPYKITSPLFERLAGWAGWRQAVLMLQEEVARRVASKPGGKTFGVLSVAVQLVADVRFLFRVSKGSFRPAPEVDSAVVELVRKGDALAGEDLRDVMRVVRASFGQRRKTILNSLSSCFSLPKAEAERALKRAGIDPARRAETVGLDAFVRLSCELGPCFDRMHV